MIINIRGTHGSGKSTIVKSIIDRYHAVPESTNAKGKPFGYKMDSPFGKIYVVGSYENACGGCDGIQPYSLIWPRVVAYAELGHVLFEGAIVSSSYGNIGRASEVYGNDFVFAFIDPPLEVCVERIMARRLAKGNNKPFEPRHVIRILKENKNVKAKAINFGRRVYALDYRRPVSQILGLLNSAHSASKLLA